MVQSAFKTRAAVGPAGTLEVRVPLPEGTPVEVLVLGPHQDEFSDLVAAAADNLGFWDNPWDDEDWNNA
jgi:hypothetical protein